MTRNLYFGLVILLVFFTSSYIQAQTYQVPDRKEISQSTGAWFGFYTKYYLNDKWAYYGEYHIRRKDWVDKMGQVYLRVGVAYKIKKYLDFTVGFVNPYYWAPDQKAENIDRVVPQYRIWEQAVLATPFDHVRVLHQLRFEHRWRRDYEKDSPFKLTHRFRYKLTMYIPLNHKDFGPGTLFLSLYNEIFIQAGKTIVYNHMEDNRAFIGLGYNPNRKWQVQAGYMYSYKNNGSPHEYVNRNIVRLSFYHHLHFHLDKQPKHSDIPIH